MCAAELHFSIIKLSEHHCSSFLSHFLEHAAHTISHFIAMSYKGKLQVRIPTS